MYVNLGEGESPMIILHRVAARVKKPVAVGFLR
jgi:hypothetical protein